MKKDVLDYRIKMEKRKIIIYPIKKVSKKLNKQKKKYEVVVDD